MKIGFDLDGTLDVGPIREVALALLKAGWEVHIITGVFKEAGSWQDADAKRTKLNRLGIPFTEYPALVAGKARLHILEAVSETYDRAYRLADMGLRKGALCFQLDVELFIDDSDTYCNMIQNMSGDTAVLKVH